MDVKAKAARLSVISNTLLVFLKFLVGLSIGSVSIISEAIHSLSDLLAAVIAFFSVRAASKPADVQHQFGHGKIENVSGTVEALLIFVAAIWVIYEAIIKILQPSEEMEVVWPGLIVMAIAVVANTLISKYLFKVAKDTDSVALEADALHLSTDVFTSLAVFLGLVVIYFTGKVWLDALIAMLVALMIFKASWDLMREAFLPLIDIGLPPEEEQIIREVIGNHAQYFIGYHELRTRKAGSERHIDLHLVVPSNAHVDSVHEFSHHVETALKNKLPNVHVLMHVEPCNNECENCDFAGAAENLDSRQVFAEKCRIKRYQE